MIKTPNIHEKCDQPSAKFLIIILTLMIGQLLVNLWLAYCVCLNKYNSLHKTGVLQILYKVFLNIYLLSLGLVIQITSLNKILFKTVARYVLYYYLVMNN